MLNRQPEINVWNEGLKKTHTMVHGNIQSHHIRLLQPLNYIIASPNRTMQNLSLLAKPTFAQNHCCAQLSTRRDESFPSTPLGKNPNQRKLIPAQVVDITRRSC